jgi:putative transposase
MKKSRFTKEEIVAILKQSEAGLQTREICRQQGISEATFYNWKAKFSGTSANEFRQKLKTLECENGRLKLIVADLTLDNTVLKELVGKKLETAKKRPSADAMCDG